jgi:hypothetical protein
MTKKSAKDFLTTPISERQRRELQRIAKMPDSEIDVTDIPEVNPRSSEVLVGRFYIRGR